MIQKDVVVVDHW